MSEQVDTGSSGSEQSDVTFDDMTLELQQLRAEAGLPSYNEIVVRITAARESLGVSPEAARPARTTVYDAFRLGRRRLDPRLVGEIVRALGVDEADIPIWEGRVQQARQATERQLPAPANERPPATAAAVPTVLRPAVAVRRLPGRVALLISIVCLALNLLGRSVVDLFSMSIYLDMVGTAIAAIILGPWRGALVGLTTNVVSVPMSGITTLPFAIVNVGGALVWGYGVRRLGFGRTLPRYFMLNVLVAVCCSALAAPIIVALGGEAHHHTDNLVAHLQETIGVFTASLLTVNLLMSMLDKLLSGFVALVAAEALGRPIRDLGPAHSSDGRVSDPD